MNCNGYRHFYSFGASTYYHSLQRIFKLSAMAEKFFDELICKKYAFMKSTEKSFKVATAIGVKDCLIILSYDNEKEHISCLT